MNHHHSDATTTDPVTQRRHGHRRRSRLIVERALAGGMLAASLFVQHTIAAAESTKCGVGEVTSVAQALEYGFWNVLDGLDRVHSSGGLGEGVESCQYRLFWGLVEDEWPTHFTEGEPIYGGVVFVYPVDELSRTEALTDLSVLTSEVTFTNESTHVTTTMEVETTQARYFVNADGRFLAQQHGFSTTLDAGRYLSTWTLSDDLGVVVVVDVTIVVEPSS